MVFSSIEFIGIFLPILFFLYMPVNNKKKKWVLFIGSLVFYAIGEPYYVLLLMASLVFNYALCKRMAQSKSHKKLILCILLLWNFGLLLFFKYFDFIAANINTLCGKELLPILHLALPLGISFYTFQMAAYQIDVYQGTQKESSGFSEFGLYVSMFPQLVAGPIVQFREVERSIKNPNFLMKNVEDGLKLFTLGLGSKVLLANQISTLFNTIQGIGASHLDLSMAWLGAFSYSFQIYFDFWGYSLMAIGLGRIFGYELPINFNNPYMAKSATDFWRRWHITLSRWFREYVYIPFGGSRKGKLKTCRNLLIVWSLTGLWHGANWNFILWGLFFFVLLVIEKMGPGDYLERHPFGGHLYCALIIPVSWMIFAQTDLGTLLAYLKAMAGGNAGHALVGTQQLLRYAKEYWFLFAVCFLCSTPLPMKAFNKYKNKKIVILMLFGIFWFSIYQIHIGKNNPFLYFRF